MNKQRLTMLLSLVALLSMAGCASVPSSVSQAGVTTVSVAPVNGPTSIGVTAQPAPAPLPNAAATVAATQLAAGTAVAVATAVPAIVTVEAPTITVQTTDVAPAAPTDAGASTIVASDAPTDAGASTVATDVGSLTPEEAAYLQKVEDLAARITNADELRAADRMFQEAAQAALTGSMPDLAALKETLAKAVTFMGGIAPAVQALRPPPHLQSVQAELQAVVDDENKHLKDEQAAAAAPTQQALGIAYGGAMAPSFDLVALMVDVSQRKTRQQTGMAQLTVDGPLSAAETDYVNKVQELTTRMTNSAELSDATTATGDAIDKGTQGGTLDLKAFNATFNKALTFMNDINTATRALQPPPRLAAVQAELLKTVVDENGGLKDSQAVISTQDWAKGGNLVANMARPMTDLMTLGTDLARLGATDSTPVVASAAAGANGPTRTPQPTLAPIPVVAGKDLTNFDPCSVVSDEEYKQAVNASTVKDGGTADDTIVVQHTQIADPSEVAGLPGSKACRQAWSSPHSGRAAQYILFLPYDQLALYRTAARRLIGFEAAGGEAFEQNGSTYLNKNGYLLTVGGMGASQPSETTRLVVIGLAQRLRP